MLDTCNEVLLRDTGLGRDEYRVVTTDVADDFGPVAAIECQGNPLRRPNRCPYDEKIGARGMNAAKEVRDRLDRLFAGVIVGCQFVAPVGPDGPQLVQVPTDGGLRGLQTLRGEPGHDRALRLQRFFEEKLAYRLSTVFVVRVGHGKSRINMRII